MSTQIIIDAIHAVLPDATVHVERYDNKYPKSGIINKIKMLFGRGEYHEFQEYQFMIIDMGMHNGKLEKYCLMFYFDDAFIAEGDAIVEHVKHMVKREVDELLEGRDG